MTRLLVIRPGAIGDTLLTLPVLQALKNQGLVAYCVLVGNAVVLPLTIASGIVDEAYDYEQARWGQLFSERGMIENGFRDFLASFDMVIAWLRDPTGLVKRNLSAAGIRNVVVTPGRPPEGQSQHIVAYLAASTGSGLLLPDMREFRLSLSSTSSKHVPDRANVRQASVAMHPGSGGARKCWPIGSYKILIEQFIARGRDIALIIGPAEEERLPQLRTDLEIAGAGHRLNLLENLPLLALAGNIQRCACFIGNDAGITHLAAMLGVPTLALFGPTDPCIWHPVGHSVTIIHEPDLEHLSATTVFEAAMSFLT